MAPRTRKSDEIKRGFMLGIGALPPVFVAVLAALLIASC